MVRGDRDTNEVEIDQLRFVAGVTGDLQRWRNNRGFGDWTYDAYVSYSRSDGYNSLEGILDEELELSLQTSMIHPDTRQIVCGTDGDGDGIPDGNDCVPVNLFHPALYQPGGGNLGSQAEHDYLFGIREFDTVVEQTIASLVLQGELFQLPWNSTSVPLVLGFEWRRDEIDSIPNDVAADGLLFGFFSDGGAVGSRSIKEFFAETELQLVQDATLAKEWSLNLAFRWTDESTYGSDTTYSVKTLYQPIDGLTFRGTYGTSFRAPNAREQFLIGQSGFNTVTDPCVVPTEAREASLNQDEPATYDPTMDNRAQVVLDNCRANGVDPISLGLDGVNTSYSVEILRQGGEQVRSGLDPETSTSITYGVTLDLPIPAYWTLRIGITWYDVEVEDSIGLLSSQFIINDCYVDNPNNTSGFCRFLTRDADGLLDNIDSSYFNINSRTSRGVDYNALLEKDFIVGDRSLKLDFDLQITRVFENTFRFEDSFEDDASTPVSPEWEGIATLRLEYRDFRFNWETRYISGEQDAVEVFDVNPPCETLDVLCRPLARTDDYWLHNTSLSWFPREWLFTFGVRNVFDRDPPLLDTAAPETQLFNLPLGAGYDLFGRTFFVSVQRSF